MMIVREPILLGISLYLGLVHAMTYVFFQAYPLSSGTIGVEYAPIMAGAAVGLVIVQGFHIIYARAEQHDRHWTTIEEYRRLLLACLGALLIPLGPLIAPFTATPSIHPAIPTTIPGLLFGIGYQLVFFAMHTYLTDVYQRYAASAQEAAAVTRALSAVGLPFTVPGLYARLGIRGAGGVLAGLLAAMAVVPAGFILFGGKLRKHGDFAG